MLHFDGSAVVGKGGVRMVLLNPEGQVTTLNFQLNFPCTNNMAEYEAFLMRLCTTLNIRAKEIKMVRDSTLVIRQTCKRFHV